MILPKVKFQFATLQSEAELLFDFCYQKSSGGMDWSEKVYKQYPEFKKRVEGIKDKNEFYDECYKYAEIFIAENREKFDEAKESFAKSWAEIEDLFLSSLSKDFETDYPEDIKEITANISMNPICPRWIDTWSFNLFYEFTEESMKKTAIHEIIHFLYFKKWLEVFLGYDVKKFEGTHPEWKLSEILVSPIINNNKVIQEIIKGKKTNVYDEWKDIKIEGKILSEHYAEIYQEHLEGKLSFADFLKKSWEDYNKNKDLIEKEMNKN